MTLNDTLEALRYCLERRCYEDAAGHLCDLLEHCRERIVPDCSPPFTTVLGVAAVYGARPREIQEAPAAHRP